MQLDKYKLIEMLAYEAFIRRVAALELPLMLKGSFVTRQYFSDPNNRPPFDLDWILLEPVPDRELVGEQLDNIMIQATEAIVHDDVTFTSFRKNRFWRRIDYSMADDFPTVNTDLECRIDGENETIYKMDVSFNLDISPPPVPLTYYPLRGNPFIIPYTAPLALQVSWKLHQMLVRPRFKDIFDLTQLLQHPSFTAAVLEQSCEALRKECKRDNVDPLQLNYLLSKQPEKLFPKEDIGGAWNYWRHGQDNENQYRWRHETAYQITDADKLPDDLAEFMVPFYEALQRAGFHQQLFVSK